MAKNKVSPHHPILAGKTRDVGEDFLLSAVQPAKKGFIKGFVLGQEAVDMVAMELESTFPTKEFCQTEFPRPALVSPVAPIKDRGVIEIFEGAKSRGGHSEPQVPKEHTGGKAGANSLQRLIDHHSAAVGATGHAQS